MTEVFERRLERVVGEKQRIFSGSLVGEGEDIQRREYKEEEEGFTEFLSIWLERITLR